MKFYQGNVVQDSIDYSGGFVYKDGTLDFFASPEGRVVKNGSNFEYQYVISDHQGNTRVLFTSASQAPDGPVATFESPSVDAQNYLNVPNAQPYLDNFIAANHTNPGEKVVRMNQNFKIGPARSLKVYPGDKVGMEVWAYYENASGFGTSSPALSTLITAVSSVFGGASGGGGEAGAIYSGIDDALTAFGPGGSQGDASPGAYLNYILFDKHYNYLTMGWQAVNIAPMTLDDISIPTVNIEQEGYIFVYLSYESESNNYVQFDDFKVTHTKSNILQYNEYYPFGLQTANSWTRENASNRYLYNGGNALNENSGWYETFFREYDAALGRFMQVDPLAGSFGSHSPYHYAHNNPWLYNDVMGDSTERFGPGSGNHWSDPYRSVEGNFMFMSRSTFEGFYGVNLNTDAGRSWVGQRIGYSLPSTSFGAIAGAYNNGGSVTINDGLISLFYCDCNAEVLTYGYRGDPVEIADGGNIVRGYNTIVDVEFEFTRTGVGRSGTWESLIPVWGSGRNAVDDFHYGDWGRGLGNAALAISDIFLLKAAVTGLARGGFKLLGSHTWNATRKYYLSTGFAESGKPLHHWLIQRNSLVGKFLPDGIKNQMWNLMPFKSQALHFQAGHGLNYLGQPGYSLPARVWFGTPTWSKAFAVSSGGRAMD